MILSIDKELSEVEEQLNRKCLEIPHAENLLMISGLGENTLAGILAEIGDISRFDDVKEIQKLSGLGLVACSSGKHKGETKISHRGRKRLRYWLFQAGKSVVSHSAEFKELHVYYTTRAKNPLKKMQSLIVIACKVLRVIYAILKNGATYDPQKMLADIRRTEKAQALAA
jgi:transposase